MLTKIIFFVKIKFVQVNTFEQIRKHTHFLNLKDYLNFTCFFYFSRLSLNIFLNP